MEHLKQLVITTVNMKKNKNNLQSLSPCRKADKEGKKKIHKSHYHVFIIVSNLFVSLCGINTVLYDICLSQFKCQLQHCIC
jgi:preprotein translocase subunit Sec63